MTTALSMLYLWAGKSTLKTNKKALQVETAKDVINDTLQELIVQANEQAIEAVEFNTAVRYMNRMMAEFAADGIPLGYSQVSNAADPITIPAGAINGLIYNLALHLATTYDVPVGPELAVKAASAKNVMIKIASQISPTSYPGTLPIGSGNEGDAVYDDKFYTDPIDTVNTELGGVVGLERLP